MKQNNNTNIYKQYHIKNGCCSNTTFTYSGLEHSGCIGMIQKVKSAVKYILALLKCCLHNQSTDCCGISVHRYADATPSAGIQGSVSVGFSDYIPSFSDECPDILLEYFH